MGPVLIFDKSFLESLSESESVWLDHFFLCNITPLFYVETLADLEKTDKKGRIPRSSHEIVKEIANKSPVVGGGSSMHHHRMVVGELLGHAVDVTHRRIHTSGGKYVKYADGSIGIDFKQFPEEAALHRWKRGQFEEIERDLAKNWRNALSDSTFQELIEMIKSRIPQDTQIKNLLDLKTFADNYVKSKFKQFIYLALDVLQVPEKIRREIIKRWQDNGWQAFEEFSPYAAHVMKVDLFFYLGLDKGLIGKERASSNKVDISYLYYLPFCHVFVSNDRLHKRIAPLFIESDQTFIPGEELKKDFRKINDFYLKLPQEDKDLGIFGFAQHPPTEIDTLVGKLHDKNLIPWRKRAKKTKKGLPYQDPKFFERLKANKENPPIQIPPTVHSDQVDSMTITRHTPVRRGGWNIVSKELIEKIENEKSK